MYVCVKSFSAAWQPSQGWRKRKKKKIREREGGGGGCWMGVDGGKNRPLVAVHWGGVKMDVCHNVSASYVGECVLEL